MLNGRDINSIHALVHTRPVISDLFRGSGSRGVCVCANGGLLIGSSRFLETGTRPRRVVVVNRGGDGAIGARDRYGPGPGGGWRPT